MLFFSGVGIVISISNVSFAALRRLIINPQLTFLLAGAARYQSMLFFRGVAAAPLSILF
jgi:hypothetical protein